MARRPSPRGAIGHTFFLGQPKARLRAGSSSWDQGALT
jgi:hypothetical protein